MLSDCWELVGRLSYLNTNKMGTTIQDSFGAAPDSGDTAEHPGGNCRDNTFISSEVQFEKATALYVGVNYYTVNQAVKATLGYEYAKFRNAFIGQIGVGAFNDQKAIVNAVRAQLQISF